LMVRPTAAALRRLIPTVRSASTISSLCPTSASRSIPRLGPRFLVRRRIILWAGFGGPVQPQTPAIQLSMTNWLIAGCCRSLHLEATLTASPFRRRSDRNLFPICHLDRKFSRLSEIRHWSGSHQYPRVRRRNSFAGVGAYALNRSGLVGNPRAGDRFSSHRAHAYNIGDGLLPADLDGMTPRPQAARILSWLDG
jgi:hypothetical protein